MEQEDLFRRTAPRPSSRQLRVQAPPERLRLLLEAHQRLLDRIAGKRADVERFDGELRTIFSAAAPRMAPFLEEARKLDVQIHGLFAALLGDKRRSARVKRDITDVHETLQREGVLSPAADEEAPPGDAASEDEEAMPPHPEASSNDSPSAGTRSGPRSGALRALFRKLAEAIHPDKVQDEAHKAARTEAMKEVTVAYCNGDFARLLELERSFQAQEPVSQEAEGDDDRRCEALLRSNELLRSQLKALERSLRQRRCSPEYQLIKAAKRFSGKPKSPGERLVEQAEQELLRLRRLHEFVQTYQARKISHACFMSGPDGAGASLDPYEVMEALLQAAMKGARGAPGRPKRRGR